MKFGIPVPGIDEGVSVVIPHYGDPQLAARLIASLHSSTCKRDVQIVVSDDASPIPFPPSPGIDVVRSDANRGFGGAVNRGASLAKHPWLLILNSDVVADSEFIDRAVSLAAGFQPALCGFAQYVPTADAWPAPAMRYPTILSTALLHSSGLHPLVRTTWGSRLARRARPEDQQTGPVEWVGGAVMLLPTAYFRMVGGFDERFFMYMEEVDLQRRLQSFGVASVFLKEVAVVHEAGMSSVGVAKEFQHWRSRFLYARRWSGALGESMLWMLMWAVVWLDASAVVMRSMLGRPSQGHEAPRERLNLLGRARADARRAWVAPMGIEEVDIAR